MRPACGSKNLLEKSKVMRCSMSGIEESTRPREDQDSTERESHGMISGEHASEEI